MRIAEVTLPASDPEALAAFHADFASATELRFEPGPDVCCHWALNVPPQRFEEAVRHAAERVQLLEEDVPFPNWRARAAYFYDPAGNIVELIARERAPGRDHTSSVSPSAAASTSSRAPRRATHDRHAVTQASSSSSVRSGAWW